ncbi:MAG TPA: MFS transporter [Solirubrobacteraceae bacterium]|nr:MFS transporter [Solirubrobacteraceae bacterium]
MLSTFLTKSRSRPLLPQAGLLRLVYGLFVACGVAQSAIVPLLPHLSARYGLSSAATALLLAVPGLATLAVSVPAGLAADRYGARRVTLAAGVLLCVSCLAQAGQSLALLMAGRIAFGIAFGIVWTTGVAWLAEVDDGADAGGSSRLGPAVTCSSVGVMIGPAVGGLLGQIAGTGLPFVLIAVVTAAVVAPLALGSTSAGERPAAREVPRRRAPRGAVLALARRPGFAAAAGGLVVAGAVSGSSQLLITAGLHADGVSTGRIGLAFSAAAVGYIAVSSAIVKLGKRAQTLRFNALATALLAMAMVPALASGAVAALVMALVLCSVPRAAVSTIAYALPSVGDGDGFVIGILNGAWAAAMVLTPVLAGALEQHGGAQLGYLAVIVPCAAIAVALIAGARPWNVAARMTAYYSSS